MTDMNKILTQLEEDIGWMRRMVKLRQYPPICFDGLLRVDRHHQTNKQNQYTRVKLWRSEIRNQKLIRIDMIPKKLH